MMKVDWECRRWKTVEGIRLGTLGGEIGEG